MNESRVFMLNGTEVSGIVTRLENFFRTEKGMEVQSSQTTDGYVMQASQPKDGWKTLTGMRLAIAVQMAVMGDKLNVSIGEGQWSDKNRRRSNRSVCCMAAGDHRRNGCIQTEKVTRRGVSGHRNYHYDRRSACGCDRRGSDGGCGNDRVSELQSAAHRRL